MPVYFTTTKVCTNPMEDFNDQSFIAHPVKFDYLDTTKLAQIISERDGHSQGQLEGLFQDYFNAIYEHVLAGQSVSMQPIGTIVPAIRNAGGTDSKDEYSSDLISQVHLGFKPSTYTKRRIQPVSQNGEAELKKWGE